MSNAREHEPSPLTPEQNQRAEALRIAAAILSDRGPFTAGSLPGGRTPDDAIALADYILTGLLRVPPLSIEAEIEDDDETCDIGGCERPIRGVPRTVMDYTDRLCATHATGPATAPEPEAGDASATEKVTEVTECQWPGCHADATGVLSLGHDGIVSLQPACGTHAGLCMASA